MKKKPENCVKNRINKPGLLGFFVGIFLLFAFLFLESAMTARAASLELKAYIFGKDNQELPDQTYEVRFSLYTQDRTEADPYPSNSDSSIWEETQRVEIKNSSLKVDLGKENSFPELNPDQDYYLGIRINTDSELVPRKKISASPFSMSAKNSQTLQGHAPGNNAGDVPLIANGGTLDEVLIPTITSVGTIATGTWEGDIIENDYVVEDLTDKTYNGLTLTNNGSSGLSIANGNATFTVSASSVSLDQDLSKASSPTFASLSLGAALSTTFGGTGLSSYNPGDILFYNSGTALSTLPIGNNGQLLSISGGSLYWADPGASSAHNFLSDAHSDTVGATVQRGDIITGQGASAKWTRLAIGASGSFLKSDGTDAAWSLLSKSDVGLINVENTALSTWTGSTNVSTLGSIASGTWNGTAINPSYLDTSVMVEGENISLLTNDAGFITESTVTASGMDNVFSTVGILKRTGVASYGIINDNSANWNNAYTYRLTGVTDSTIGLDFTLASNNITLGITSGYVIPTTTEESNWNTAYANRLTSTTAPLSILGNAISISQATITTNGYLSSADWNAFSSKQSALTVGDLTSSTTGLTVTGGTGSIIGLGTAISIDTASGSSSGLLTDTDWTTFNTKQAAYTNLTSFGNLDNSAGYLYNDGSGNFSYGTPSGTSLWTESGTDIYFNTGNVGVGTTSPQRLLSVNGAMNLASVSEPATPVLGDLYTNADGNLYFYNGSTWDDLTAASSTSSLWTQFGSDIYFNTGNVGIGTTSPNQALTVIGAIETSDYFSGTSSGNTNLRATGAVSGGNASIFFKNYAGVSMASIDTAYPTTIVPANSDGSLSVSTETAINTVATTGTTDGSVSGQKTVNVVSTSGLSVGDVVLVIQMKGGAGDGYYETKLVYQINSATQITVESNLSNSYSQTTNSQCGSADSNCYQVVRIPRYSTVAVNNGGTLTAPAWNSNTGTGGILWFEATGTVEINAGGIVDMNGKGYTGGTGGVGGSSDTNGSAGSVGTGPGGAGGGLVGGNHGVGTATTGQSGGGAGGTGGGGGGAGALAAGNTGSAGVSGAGGAGNVVAGGTGSSGAGGSAGAQFSGSFSSRIVPGSGGGGGAGGNGGGRGANDPGGSGGVGGVGGTGGGVVVMHTTGAIINSGIVQADGSSGNSGSKGGNISPGSSYVAIGGGGSGGAGGGGGAGGSIWLNSNSVTQGTVSNDGGTGGTGGNGGSSLSGGLVYITLGGGGAGTVGGSGYHSGANAAPGTGGSGSVGLTSTDDTALTGSGQGVAVLDIGGINVQTGLGTYVQDFIGTANHAMGITADSLTSGSALNISSASTVLTDALARMTLSGSDAGNTGSVLSLVNSGISNTGNTLYVQNYSAGPSLLVEDELGDVSPFIINAAGNVGIGTTSPGYDLDVAGNVNFTGTLYQNGVAFSGGSGLWTESGSDIYFNTGNVGIGTTSPGTALTVDGVITATGGTSTDWNAKQTAYDNLTSFGNLANSAGYLYNDGSGNFSYGTPSGTSLWTESGSNIYFSTGNVGIGTTSPGALLSVAGNVGLDSGSYLAFGSTIGTSGYGIRDNSGTLEYKNSGGSWTTLGSGGTSDGIASLTEKYSLTEDEWKNTGSALSGVLKASQTAVIGDYIYLFGGNNGSATNVIYRAPVTDPTSWSDTGATIPGNLQNSQTAVIGDYVYLFGGYNGSAVTNIIYRAPISDPTSWSNTGATLPGSLGYSKLAVIGDYVYLFGGYTSSATNVIYRAPISDPTSWSNTGATLPASLYGSNLSVIGDYVYLFGGVYSNVIYRAPVTDPTSWTDTGATLPEHLAYSQTIVIGDYVYLFGGRDEAVVVKVIYRAPVSDPTSWLNTSSTIPVNLQDSQAAVVGNYVYLFGGNNGTSALSIIYRAPITSFLTNDSLASFPDVTSNKNWKYKASTTIGGGGSSLFTLSGSNVYLTDVSQNLGIGTTAPGALLEIAGDGGDGYTTPMILLNDTGGANTDDIGIHSAGGRFTIRNETDNTTLLYIDNDTGNVGIGMTAPNARLQIAGVDDLATSFAAKIGGTTTTGLVVQNNGYVGIGTTSPLGILHAYQNTSGTAEVLLDNPSGDMILSINRGGSTKAAQVAFLTDTLTLNWIMGSVDTGDVSGSDGSEFMIGTAQNDPKLWIQSGGNVGIGTTGPSRKLFVNGDAGGTTAWYNDSDARLKENIETITNPLEKIMNLRGVSFKWKDETNHVPGDQIGFIAQEALSVLPQVVSKAGDYYGMQYAPITALLVEGMKQQQSAITGISNSQFSISNQFSNLNTLISQLKNDNLSVEDKIILIGTSIDELDSRIDGQDEQLAQMQSQLSELTLTMDNINSFMETANKMLSDHEQRIAQLESLVMSNDQLQISNQILSPNAEKFFELLSHEELDGKVKFTVDGDLKAENLEVAGVKVGENESAPTIGNAMIFPVETDEDGDGLDDKTGSDGQSVKIETTAISEKSKIFISFTSDLGGRSWHISGKNPGESFLVKLSVPINEKLNFDWWVVDVIN